MQTLVCYQAACSTGSNPVYYTDRCKCIDWKLLKIGVSLMAGDWLKANKEEDKIAVFELWENLLKLVVKESILQVLVI